MRLWLVTPPAPAVVDLNAVRLETLRGAARDAVRRIAAQVRAHPAWFDADERAQWGFALGQACAMLDRALRVASRDTAVCGPLDAYRATRAATADIARRAARTRSSSTSARIAAMRRPLQG